MNNKLEIENQLFDEIHQLSIDKIELVLKIVLLITIPLYSSAKKTPIFEIKGRGFCCAPKGFKKKSGAQRSRMI